jgi:O-antigen/teichoic acid export membrane protein
MLLKHFGQDYFSLLMLVYAIITYINNIKLGIPESLAMLVAKQRNTELSKLKIKKSFLILIAAVCIALSIIFLVNALITDWRIILGDVYQLEKDSVLDVLYVLVGFALIRIPLDLSLSVYIGFHDVYLEKIYRSINLIVNFLLVLFVVQNNHNIIFFVWSAAIADLLVSIASFVHALFKYKIYKSIRHSVNFRTTRLLSSGVHFFQLNLTQTIVWGAGIFLVSHLLSLESVAIYSLTMKIYVFIFYAFTIINTVIAPLYGRCIVNNDYQLINRVFNISILLLPFIGGAIWIVTIVFMEDIILLWTSSDHFFIGNYFILFMGLFFYTAGYIYSYITLIYSLGKVSNILFIRWAEVLFGLFLSFVLVKYIGVLGIAIGLASASLLISMQYMPTHIRKEAYINLDFSSHKKHFFVVLLPSVIAALILVEFYDSIWEKIIAIVILLAFYSGTSWKLLDLETREDMTNHLFNVNKA